MGVLGGVLSGFFGIGGGIVIVPLLILLARLDQRTASATSLVAIVPTALVGALSYGARGEVDVVAGLLVAAGGVVGSLIGARFLRRLPLAALSWAFIGLLLLAAASIFIDVSARSTQVALGVGSAAGYVALGVFIGVASGLFGIGGGVVAVPVLIAVFGMPALMAKGTSLLMMLPTSISGSISHIRTRIVDVTFGLLVGGGAVAGSFGGVALAHSVPERLADILFAALLLYSALQLALKQRSRVGSSGT